MSFSGQRIYPLIRSIRTSIFSSPDVDNFSLAVMSKDFFQARLGEVRKMTTVLNSFTVSIPEGQIAGTVRADAEVKTRARCAGGAVDVMDAV